MEQWNALAEQLKNFIKPELLILIPVLYWIGYAVKRSKVADEWIPWIIGVTGIVLSGLYVCGTESLTLLSVFTSVTQGILCAWASVFVNS